MSEQNMTKADLRAFVESIAAENTTITKVPAKKRMRDIQAAAFKKRLERHLERHASRAPQHA